MTKTRASTNVKDAIPSATTKTYAAEPRQNVRQNVRKFIEGLRSWKASSRKSTLVVGRTRTRMDSTD